MISIPPSSPARGISSGLSRAPPALPASPEPPAEPEPPAWHGDILAERRRRVAAGEERFIPLEEAMRQLREEVACR